MWFSRCSRLAAGARRRAHDGCAVCALLHLCVRTTARVVVARSRPRARVCCWRSPTSNSHALSSSSFVVAHLRFLRLPLVLLHFHIALLVVYVLIWLLMMGAYVVTGLADPGMLPRQRVPQAVLDDPFHSPPTFLKVGSETLHW